MSTRGGSASVLAAPWHCRPLGGMCPGCLWGGRLEEAGISVALALGGPVALLTPHWETKGATKHKWPAPLPEARRGRAQAAAASSCLTCSQVWGHSRVLSVSSDLPEDGGLFEPLASSLCCQVDWPLGQPSGGLLK